MEHLQFHCMINSWCSVHKSNIRCTSFDEEERQQKEEVEHLLTDAMKYLQDSDGPTRQARYTIQSESICLAIDLLGLDELIDKETATADDFWANFCRISVKLLMREVGEKRYYSQDQKGFINGLDNGEPMTVVNDLLPNPRSNHDLRLAATASHLRNFTSWARVQDMLYYASWASRSPQASACKLPDALGLPDMFKEFL